MKRFYFLLLLLCLRFIGWSQSVEETYDLLSSKDSEWLMEQGRAYFSNQQGEKALPYFLIVSERYKEDKSEEAMRNSVRALNNIGCVFKYCFNDYLQAYDYFTRAYDLSEANKFEDFMPMILTNLSDLLNDYGIIYDSEEMRRKADDIFKQSFKQGLKNKDWNLLATSFFNIANNNYELNLSDYRALLSEEIPDTIPFVRQTRLLYKGIESLQAKDNSRARQYFQEQLQSLPEGLLGERIEISSLKGIAESYHREENNEMYISYLEKALQEAGNENIIDLTTTLSKKLEDLYANSGNSEKASEYHYKYLDAIQQIHETRLGTIGELNYFYEFKKQEEKARELQYKERRQTYITVTVILILVIVLVAAIIILRKNRFLHARNKTLYEHYQTLLNTEKEPKKSEEKYSHTNLNEEQRAELEARIKDVIENPEYICKHEFGLKDLAKLVDSNTTYVSRVVNETYNESFSNVLSANRVKEACRRINEREDYQRITIEAIANDVGFKSRNAFLNAFKREVGLNPSEYIKMAKEAKSG